MRIILILSKVPVWLLGILCLAMLHNVQATDTATYKGFGLYRATPNSHDDLLTLLKLQDEMSGVDFWKPPSVVKKGVDFMLPDTARHVINNLKNAGVSVEEMPSKLQMLVDNLDSTYNADAHKRNLSSLDLNAYHTFEVISLWMDHTVRTCTLPICRLDPIGHSYERRPLNLIQIGVTENPIIFLECGIHAREWISPAVCLKIINTLLSGYGKDDQVTDLLNNYSFYIIPVTNPDGYQYTHTKERLWRKTRRPNLGENSECYGTDPNRNWGRGWGGAGSSSDPCSQIYRGPKAFSEPETKAVRDYVLGKASQILVYISIHSYGQHVLIPWSYQDKYPEDYKDMFEVASALSFGIWQSSGLLYTVGQSYGIMGATSGSSDDWAKGEAGIKFSYTLEVRDSGEHGFLLPPNQIHDCFAEVFNGLKFMAHHIAEKQFYGLRK